MCTHDLCFEQNKKNITIFHLKVTILTALNNHSILHRHVCVMPAHLNSPWLTRQ